VKTLEWQGPFAHGEVFWTRELEAEMDIEAAAEFITGESAIYPAFAAYVRGDNQDWLDEQWEDEPDEDD
jgi:hypothetical protein